MYGEKNYQMDVAAQEIRRSSVSERLEREQKSMQTRLDELNQALDALKKHPELAHLLDLVSRVA